jgi:signal transduction histidine kinase/FixJ family two-component response regulator
MLQSQAPLILVADDDHDTTTLLQYVFERERFRVEKADNGAAALKIAQAQKPDLILLDVMMPLLNGFDVLRTLRSDQRTARIPTIIITANATGSADVARGLNLGADDFLIKPIQPAELIARVKSKIRARQLEDALARRTSELEALLQAAEQFNQHLAPDELLDTIIALVMQILPSDTALVLYLDGDGNRLDHRLIGERDAVIEKILDQSCSKSALELGASILRLTPETLKGLYADGLMTVLRHGGALVGAIVLLHKTEVYDDYHCQLFGGIARQAALALNNMRLFSIQANYAQHLEEMVNQRTQALQSAQKMIILSEKLAAVGTLAASIAHEIGNSIQPIKPLVDDLAEDLINQSLDYDKRSLTIIRENIDRIARIIDLVRDFASSRPKTDDLHPLDLSGLLLDMLDLNHKLLEHKRIRVCKQLPEVALVYGSRSQLQGVFMNLMLNAVDAMQPEGGTLTVRVQQAGDFIEAEIADTGCGIPPDIIDQIFDPFFTTKPNGTGLGLSISHSIVQNHQGTIEVRSEVGKGSQFIVRLPIHADHS